MATVVDSPTTRSMALAALILTAFAVVGTTMVALTYTGTKGIIAATERRALLDNLNTLVNPDRYDNRPTEDTIAVIAPAALGTAEPVTVYRARRDGQPVALMAAPVAPDGYGGPIMLLVGVNWDGTVAGVRVLAHRETPGLGDGIEAERSDWIESFQGKSLGNPPAQQWAVKKDGGAFDQFTGATITPRAVVGAVRRFLEYYRVNRERLFLPAGSRVQEAVHAPPPDPAAPTSPASTGPLEANAQDPIESVQDTGKDVEQVSKP